MKEKKLEEAKSLYETANTDQKYVLESLFPELKESEDEKIRKSLIILLQHFCKGYRVPGLDFPVSYKDMLTWLEKQGEQKPNYTTLVETGNGGINALVTREVFNNDYEEKPADRVEPKFKVKYAGSEYNVLEIKEIAGVTYYGIEDEPNHIDYVLPDNCEIVRDHSYSVKEKGSPYPTNSAIFSEQKPTWSEEDEEFLRRAINAAKDAYPMTAKWLKSLKQRYTWKPSDEQMGVLLSEVTGWKKGCPKQIVLESLYNDLKKLK